MLTFVADTFSPPPYSSNGQGSTAWSPPASAVQTAINAPLPSHESSYYSQHTAQYIPSASPLYDYSQHALQHYPQSYSGSSAHSGGYPGSGSQSRSTSYAGYSTQPTHPPISAGPQYENFRRTVTMPQTSSTGMNVADSVYSSNTRYPGRAGPGTNLAHSTQEQYDAWNQYGEQEGTAYHEHQPAYGPNQWT